MTAGSADAARVRPAPEHPTYPMGRLAASAEPEYRRLKRAAVIAEGIMGKRASEDDPLAYWTLINTLLEFASP